MYGYGARNVLIVGLGPIGCMPHIISRHFLGDTTGQCIEMMQQVPNFMLNRQYQLPSLSLLLTFEPP